MQKFIYALVFVLISFFATAQTITEIVVNSPDHTTLEAAVIAAELDGVLNSPGNFTVFAPTDAAFAALPAGTVDQLLLDPTGNLAKILLYHVLGAEVFSGDLSDGQTATTLLGQGITVTLNADGAFINGAKISVVDLDASNGVVHVLDAVILPPASTVVDVVVNSPVHTTLEAAVTAAGLVPALQGDGPFTVFAPTDDAFAALPAGTVDALLMDPTGDLAKILLYHVVGGEVLSSDLSDGQMAATLLGQGINVSINADGVFINDAKVVISDIRTFNGVVHVLDAVMLPPSSTVADVVINSPVHTTLETAVVAAGLAPALSDPDANLTVFAPTDDAFAALPPGLLDGLLADPTGNLAKVLLYHVVGGEVLSTDLMNGMMANTLLGQGINVSIDANGVMINNAMVTVADIRTLNGVVHVLDAVLVPPSRTVADVVINSPVHETLEAAVIAAGLVPTLSDLTADLTVFAPTDAAFAALPAGTVEALLMDPTGDLAKVLTYHVLGAEVLSTDLSDGQMAMTVNGQEITVSIDADGVLINNAKVTVADIRTLNGVVHVIDAVLLPSLSSVRDLETIPMTVSPNPTTDVLNIDIPASMNGLDVQLTMVSIDGKIVKNQKVNQTQINLNVTDLRVGTYILNLRSETSFAKATVIIE